MVPAELATWVIGGRCPASVSAASTSSNRSSWAAGEVAVADVVSVGHGQVGPDRAEPQARGRRR